MIEDFSKNFKHWMLQLVDFFSIPDFTSNMERKINLKIIFIRNDICSCDGDLFVLVDN